MNIQEYLKRVSELEQLCYEQNRLIHKLESQLNHVQNPRLKQHISTQMKDDGFPTWLCVGGAAFLILVIPLELIYRGKFFVLGPIKLEFGDVAATGIALLLALLCYTFIDRPFNAEKSAKQRKVHEINQKIDAENQELQRSIPAQIASLNSQIACAKSSYQETCSVLSQYYKIKRMRLQ